PRGWRALRYLYPRRLQEKRQLLRSWIGRSRLRKKTISETPSCARLDGSETRPHASRPHASRPHTSPYAGIPDDRRRSSSTASQITSPGKSFATSTLPIVLGKIKWTTPPRVFLSERISRRTLRLRTSTFGRGPRLSTALRMRVASV